MLIHARQLIYLLWRVFWTWPQPTRMTLLITGRSQVIDSIKGNGRDWNRETGRGVIDAHATLSAV